MLLVVVGDQTSTVESNQAHPSLTRVPPPPPRLFRRSKCLIETDDDHGMRFRVHGMAQRFHSISGARYTSFRLNFRRTLLFLTSPRR